MFSRMYSVLGSVFPFRVLGAPRDNLLSVDPCISSRSPSLCCHCFGADPVRRGSLGTNLCSDKRQHCFHWLHTCKPTASALPRFD
ncbi:hypothetical protein F5Y15DRAFT_254402 [Xylariaceae sp. FL0016]|nr:hypothetical protein F5Y15DRAFT_254402 [Xylariaceae sp. FL0016]